MEPQLPKLTSQRRARRARRIQRIVSLSIGLVITLAVVSIVVAYAVSESRLNETFSIEREQLVLASELLDVARGERLVRGALRCTECHGKDLGGRIIVDTEIGRVAAPNLTRGKGGLGATLTDSDWVRALRHGVGRDEKGLWMMPTRRFAHLQDQDIADVIGYVQTVSPVDRQSEVSHLGLLGRLVHALGKLELIDPQTEGKHRAAGPAENEVSMGGHIARLSGCDTCHGDDFRGGGDGMGSDLIEGAFSAWTLDDFVKAMRQGIRPDSQAMSDAMPWPEIGRLSDDELKHLFVYLRSLGAAQ